MEYIVQCHSEPSLDFFPRLIFFGSAVEHLDFTHIQLGLDTAGVCDLANIAVVSCSNSERGSRNVSC